MRFIRMIIIMSLLILPFGSRITRAESTADRQLLRMVMNYPRMIINQPRQDTLVTYGYTKYRIEVERRNFTILGIPTLFYIARDGRREYFGENYSQYQLIVDRRDKRGSRHRHPLSYRVDRRDILNISTIYHNHRSLTVVFDFLKPRFYEPTLFGDHILSPINKHNRRYYQYSFLSMGTTTMIRFKPRLKNTELVEGWVMAEQDGRITEFYVRGEYDMIAFGLKGTMGDHGFASTLPARCDISAEVNVMGNKLQAYYTSVYNQQTPVARELWGSDNIPLMESLRPIPLTPTEEHVVKDYLRIRSANDSIAAARADSLQTVTAMEEHHQRKSFFRRLGKTAKYIFWDILGDNMVNRINTDLGSNRQGHLRIGPLLNPLYFEYSAHRGLVYKCDVNGNYTFSPQQKIEFRTRLGYAFKLHQFYFDIPLTYTFNKRRNGFIQIEIRNGNRITNSRILDEIKAQQAANPTMRRDTINWDAMSLDYFKDMEWKTAVNYDIIPDRLGLQAGLITHRRSAVHPEGFLQAGKETVYHSTAPFLQLSYRPVGQEGPVITAQWERGMRGLFGANTRYEKMEADLQYILPMICTRSLSLRFGSGIYTNRDDHAYFLDYSNFQLDFLPGGWQDRWTGDFELLNSNWYNASKYYIRANATYESPLMFLTFIPKLGQIIERERLYASSLCVAGLNPYVELGYGCTTRAVSIGIFTGFTFPKFNGVGMKFSFELFNNW